AWLASRRRGLARMGALVPLLLLAGCASSALDLAPSRPDQPWTPAVSATGEIIPGAKPNHASSEMPDYRLPANSQLSVVPQPPDIDQDHAYSLPELIDIAQSNNPVTRIAWNA